MSAPALSSRLMTHVCAMYTNLLLIAVHDLQPTHSASCTQFPAAGMLQWMRLKCFHGSGQRDKQTLCSACCARLPQNRPSPGDLAVAEFTIPFLAAFLFSSTLHTHTQHVLQSTTCQYQHGFTSPTPALELKAGQMHWLGPWRTILVHARCL